MIRTLTSLNNKGYQFEYHIVGDGPERRNLEALANENGLSHKVVFHGHQSQKAVVRLLKQAHIFLMPSYPETLGRAFLEAAAAGCLCVGHEKTGIDGLFAHRESALFVNARTIEGELECLFSNFSPERLEMYLTESRRIAGQLTWGKIGAEYNAIYSKACIDLPP